MPLWHLYVVTPAGFQTLASQTLGLHQIDAWGDVHQIDVLHHLHQIDVLPGGKERITI